MYTSKTLIAEKIYTSTMLKKTYVSLSWSNHIMELSSEKPTPPLRVFAGREKRENILWYACPFDFRHFRPCTVLQK